MESTEAPKVDDTTQKKLAHRLCQKKYRETKKNVKVKPNCPTCGYALQKMFINTPTGKIAHPTQMYCKMCHKVIEIA